MSRIDQFESVFKAAARTVFVHERIAIRRVAAVTDLEAARAAGFTETARSFLAVLDSDSGEDGGENGGGVAWLTPEAARCRTVGDILGLVEELRPDLVCTYRNLHTEAWRWPYSLGDQVDVLTQATDVPVLVLPRPDDAWEGSGTDSVMALTDHLKGDAHLVSWAARCTAPGGTLCLTHIEDQATFDRYVGVIGRIPEIDTDLARDRIGERLLTEASEYIVSCKEVLRRESLPIRLEKVVAFGHRLGEIRQMVGARQVDLLVLNTKDRDQVAMHGMAYALAVELRNLPLLLL